MTQPSRGMWLFVGLLIGAAFGGAGGWLSRGTEVTPASDRSVNSTAPVVAHSSAVAHDSNSGLDRSDQRSLLPPSSASRTEVLPASFAREAVAPMFSAALLAHAEAQLIRGWRAKRSDVPTVEVLEEGDGIFRKQTLALPVGIGVKLADRLSAAELAAEDARTGGVFAVLSRLEDGSPGPLFEVVDSARVFDQFFQGHVSGPYLPGATALKSREPLADGANVGFPAGVFELSDFGGNWRDHYPRDLTISGAGKDATLLVLRSDWSAYDTVRNLTIENCTIYADNNYLFDVRKPAMSVTVRRCRLTGWTTGAGSSCLFGTEALALRVIDSEITGAYNRTPTYGQLFDVRSNGLLARFENCMIEACHVFRGTQSGATLVFANCVMRNILDRPKETGRHAKLLGTRIEWFEGEDRKALKRDLNELFPDWRKQMR